MLNVPRKVLLSEVEMVLFQFSFKHSMENANSPFKAVQSFKVLLKPEALVAVFF